MLLKRKKKGLFLSVGSVRQLLKFLFSTNRKTGNDISFRRKSTESDRDVLENRLNRLKTAYRASFRMDGNLCFPEWISTVNGDDVIHYPCFDADAVPLRKVSNELKAEQKDILFGTILAQLDQLAQLGFVHTGWDPEHLLISMENGTAYARILGLEEGFFEEECPVYLKRPHSLFEAPEVWRAVAFGKSAKPDIRWDVFSAGCIYYYILTGRVPETADERISPAESMVWVLPLVWSPVLTGPRRTLIRWMLDSQMMNRPDPDQALQALKAIREKRYVSWDSLRYKKSSAAAFALRNFEKCEMGNGRKFCYLAEDSRGQTYFFRYLDWLWNPGASPTQADWFTDRQNRLVSEEYVRLQRICKESQYWSKNCRWIAEGRAVKNSFGITFVSGFPAKACLTLRDLRKMHDSVFLLDMRMTEILQALQTLHNSDCLLGLVSENCFCVEILEDGNTGIRLFDFSSAFPEYEIPAPDTFHPDPEEGKMLSPEMNLYLTSENENQVREASDRIGPSNDIFSAGLLYHRILTGKFPDMDPGIRSNFGNAAGVDNGIILDPSLDTEHRELIRSMLQMDPEKRPAGCDEITAAILDFYTR